MAGADYVDDDRIPPRRALLQHRLTHGPGSGPLAHLGAETAAALHREYGDHPLPLAPALR